MSSTASNAGCRTPMSGAREPTHPYLPMVKCRCCLTCKIRAHLSRTEDNYNIRFYKCPNHGNGFNSWWWESAYAIWLTSHEGIPFLLEEMGITNPQVQRSDIDETKNSLNNLLMLVLVILVGLAAVM